MEIGVLIIVIFVLLNAASKSPTVRGKIGEFRVSRLLKKDLNPSVYRVLGDVTVPSINGTTQIDHVVVSPFGIFVIETKNYNGWIFGNVHDANWTQTIYKNKSRFQNPIRQNYAHVKALETITGLEESVFHSMVVFTGSAEFKTPIPDEVCGLADLLQRIKLKGRHVLSPAQLVEASSAIQKGRLQPGFMTDSSHINSLGERFENAAKQDMSRGVSQGIGQIVFVAATKLLAVAAVIVVGILLVSFVKSAFTNLSVLKTQPSVRQSNSPLPVTKRSSHNEIEPSAWRQEQQVITKQLELEKDLLCGYSIDTNRCACYDRKGNKIELVFERCKELASGER